MFGWEALRRQGRQAETYGVDQPRGGHPRPTQETGTKNPPRKAAWERAKNVKLGERMRSARKHRAHRIQPVKQDPFSITRKVCVCFDCVSYRSEYHVAPKGKERVA